MMADYISREAAIEEIDKWLDTVGTALVGKGLSYYGELIGCIEDARAADVAPVVHGQWVDNGIPDSILNGCSVCGFTCGSRSFFYCPNCGAKMDESDEPEN